jgi:hypothetical protein
MAILTEEEAALATLDPAALFALTVKVYVVPPVNPDTTTGDAEPELTIVPGDDVTVYEVISDPPSKAGAVNATDACSMPAVATALVGAPGRVYGFVGLLLTLGALTPVLFVAVTLIVYSVPFVSPVSVNGEADPLTVKLPGLAATVYDIMFDPPKSVGGSKITWIVVLPLTSFVIVGAFGTVGGSG